MRRAGLGRGGGLCGGGTCCIILANTFRTVGRVLRALKQRALAQAIVDTVREPLLVLDKDLRVVAASRSFYLTFQVNRQDTQGRHFFELGDGQWDIPGLRALMEKILPAQNALDGYEVEHDFPDIGRRIMLLNARKVFYEDDDHTTILLAIEDVTQRREAERQLQQLLQQKELLLEEMQHRVGNSLQIIASILMLKARTVQSEETRLHLQDAHTHVMSLARSATAALRIQARRADGGRSLPLAIVRDVGRLDDRGEPRDLGGGRGPRRQQYRPVTPSASASSSRNA